MGVRAWLLPTARRRNLPDGCWQTTNNQQPSSGCRMSVCATRNCGTRDPIRKPARRIATSRAAAGNTVDPPNRATGTPPPRICRYGMRPPRRVALLDTCRCVVRFTWSWLETSVIWLQYRKPPPAAGTCHRRPPTCSLDHWETPTMTPQPETALPCSLCGGTNGIFEAVVVVNRRNEAVAQRTGEDEHARSGRRPTRYATRPPPAFGSALRAGASNAATASRLAMCQHKGDTLTTLRERIRAALGNFFTRLNNEPPQATLALRGNYRGRAPPTGVVSKPTELPAGVLLTAAIPRRRRPHGGHRSIVAETAPNPRAD